MLYHFVWTFFFTLLVFCLHIIALVLYFQGFCIYVCVCACICKLLLCFLFVPFVLFWFVCLLICLFVSKEKESWKDWEETGKGNHDQNLCLKLFSIKKGSVESITQILCKIIKRY